MSLWAIFLWVAILKTEIDNKIFLSWRFKNWIDRWWRWMLCRILQNTILQRVFKKEIFFFAADRTSCYLVTLNLSRPVFRHHIKMSGEKIFVFNFRFKNCHLYEYCPYMTFTIQKLGKLKYKANSYGASLLKNFKKLWGRYLVECIFQRQLRCS